ncbi:TetR/AcrR family transcriptional regulator [Microbacterium sp. P07]|uniref:TetR/AcrR family transcriptional regulator n=1 Tax=Microbacterium sp. P07 TaxID=3366952 RepID=UPI003746CC5C
MAPARTGRPRVAGPSPTGQGTRADVLTAAAALFCTRGYTSSSTHAIAEAAGIRQASMYHHFERKHDILLALLLETVQPSLEVAAQLLAADDDPAARLWALCVADVRLLSAGPENVGALYLLPEVSEDAFLPFRERRNELETTYKTLVAASGVADDRLQITTSLVLGLVESVILQRKRGVVITERTAEAIASAALRVLDLRPDAISQAVAVGRDALDRIG